MSTIKQAFARAIAAQDVPNFLATKSKLQRANLSSDATLAHALALGDPSGGTTIAAGTACDATTKKIAINASAQAAVDAGFPPLEDGGDFGILMDWQNMPQIEQDKGMNTINLVAPAAAAGLGYGACNLKWKSLDNKTMTTNTPTKGDLWKVVCGLFS